MDKFPSKKDSIYFQYNVKDIDRAKKFYYVIFSFEIIWDGGIEVGWCELALPVKGVKLGLNLKREGEIAPGSGTLTLYVADLAAAKSYLEDKDKKKPVLLTFQTWFVILTCMILKGIEFIS